MADPPVARQDRPGARPAFRTPRRRGGLWRDRSALAGLALISMMVACAAAAPWLAPYNPTQQNLRLKARGPSWEHVLGTDGLGRDLLSRMLYGARYTLGGAVAAVGIGALTGSAIGVVIGYVGGRADDAVMRLMDGMLAFPYIVTAVFLAAFLNPGLFTGIVAVGIASVPAYVRLMRGIVLGIRGQEYVQAAVATGATGLRVIWHHVLPNSVSPVIVYASLDTASAIIRLSSLSFIGMGAQPPAPEWGAMLNDAQEWFTAAPHMSVVPGTALVLAAVAFNLVGEGVRDALDPRVIK